MLPKFAGFAISMQTCGQVISMFLIKFSGMQMFGSALDQGHTVVAPYYTSGSQCCNQRYYIPAFVFFHLMKQDFVIQTHVW